jgi:hypothetical protein
MMRGGSGAAVPLARRGERMTIVVGVAAPDGLVLAADSRSTRVYDGTHHHRVATNTAQKVFSVCSCYGVASYGSAFIGRSTIAGVMDEFIAEVDGAKVPSDIREFSEVLGAFFQERLMRSGVNPAEGWKLGFLVGGYTSGGMGQFHHVRVPGDPDPKIIPLDVTTETLGVVTFGMTEAWTRLVAGVDWDRLAAAAVDVPDEIRNALEDFEYNLIYPITMQDAIEYADFVIRTTVDIGRFSNGTLARPGSVEACGGASRILAVGPNDVLWINRPALAPPARFGADGRGDA